MDISVLPFEALEEVLHLSVGPPVPNAPVMYLGRSERNGRRDRRDFRNVVAVDQHHRNPTGRFFDKCEKSWNTWESRWWFQLFFNFHP